MSEGDRTNQQNMHHVTIHKARKAWYKRFWFWAIVVLLLICIGAANSNNKPTVVDTTNHSVSGNSNCNSTGCSGAEGPGTGVGTGAGPAKVGDTLELGGSSGLAVTLVKVIDPATGADQFTTPDAGKRFVAVDVKIANKGTSAYQDDANSDVSLIGTDGQAYTVDFSNVAQCTNFNDGDYTLAGGESITGCVVFQLPTGISTSKVQFQDSSDDTGEWDIN